MRKRGINRILFFVYKNIYKQLLFILYRLTGPPRILKYDKDLNANILRKFGAKIGYDDVRILSPLTLHGFKNNYKNLTIKDHCVINGNNFFDLSAPIILEEGVSIGPGVIIMTHNWYNRNDFLVERLKHTCGKKAVHIMDGSGIKAGSLIVMGVTIGKNAVVAGNAVVNRDISDNCLVAGIPAKIIRTFDENNLKGAQSGSNH